MNYKIIEHKKYHINSRNKTNLKNIRIIVTTTIVEKGKTLRCGGRATTKLDIYEIYLRSFFAIG